MAEMYIPKWGLALAPNINPVDASFTNFFPRSSSSSTVPDASSDSWTASFAVPTPHTRPPAWSRVAIPPHSSTRLRGAIMKRVGLDAPRSVVSAHTIAQNEKTAVSEAEVDEEERRRIRRRGLKYEPATQEVQFQGAPCSRAESAALLMRAKVDASNNFMVTSSGTPFEDKISARTGTYVRVCPAKRYFGTDVPSHVDPVGGNKLPIYREVLPIIVRAARKGLSEVDYTTASIAEASAIMRQVRRSRNPRQRLAVHGTPDLSDISDETEPESAVMIKPPTLKAESRSPQKRIARLTKPVKNGIRRITSNIIKLVPGSSPKAEPSPNKSSSTPSTPLRLSPTPTKTAASQSGDSSPSSRSAVTAPEYPADEYSQQPGRTFTIPDSTLQSSDSSQSVATAPEHSVVEPATSPETPRLQTTRPGTDSTVEDLNTPFPETSPTKYSRPVAPTPSRWNRLEPATPQALTPAPKYQNDSPIGLASLVLPTTPIAAKCPYKPEMAATDFRFGATSPSFNSVSWMNSSVQASEPRRIQNVNTARRRQSEPLIRKYLKTQARRQSLSPRKVTFQDENSLFQNTSISSIFPSIKSNASEAVDVKAAGNSDHAMADPTPAQEHDDQAEENAETSTYAPTIQDGVLNIDMRQNQDIFHASISQLADMAQDRCSGHAKVVVTEENGRLFVRFKLSAEHAYLFPPSQGFDDQSHFASSPLMSRSPRLRLNAQPPLGPQPQSTPGTAASKKTRFAASPASHHFLATTPLGREPNSDLGSLLDTPDMSVSYATPTMVMADTPTVHTSIAKPASTIQTPREASSSLGSLLGTPSMSVNFATPTMVMADDSTPVPRSTVKRASVARTPNFFQAQRVPGSVSLDTPATNVGDATPTLIMTDTPAAQSSPIKTGYIVQTPQELKSDLGSLLDTPCMSVQYATPTMVTALETTPATRRSLAQTLQEPNSDLGSLLDTPSMSVHYATPTMVMAQDATPATQRFSVHGVHSDQATPIAKASTVPHSQSSKSPLSDMLPSSADPLPLQATPMQRTEQQIPLKQADDSITAAGSNQTFTEQSETNQADDSIPADAQKQTVATFTPTAAVDAQPINTTPITTPTLTTSFTPVNKSSPRNQTHSEEQATYKETPLKTAGTADNSTTAAAQQEVYDDSPGRDYMRDFIKRSRRTSTTETGSPMAPLGKRQPLVAKSPNPTSPQKKRKLQDEVDSPAKKQKKDDESKATGRKTRRTTKPSRQQSELAIEMTDDPATVVAAAAQTANADEQQDGEEPSAPATRRSSRLRSTGVTSTPKSSIPTAIKLGRSGAGRGTVLNSTVRSDQQELTAQTRLNTKRNRGNAEYPAQVLARVAEAAKEDSDEADSQSNSSGASADRKSVVWKEPLEEEEKPRKGRAAAKAKATLGKSGIGKPKGKTSADKSKRTAKVAESLGMVANGTPARPQRMTRSQTRSRS